MLQRLGSIVAFGLRDPDKALWRLVDMLTGRHCDGCEIGGLAHPHSCSGRRLYAIWREDTQHVNAFGHRRTTPQQ